MGFFDLQSGLTPPEQGGTYGADGTYRPLQFNMSDPTNAAANATAAILRGNYDNWKKNYFPKVGELMQQTTYANPNLVAQETGKIDAQVASSFGNAMGSNSRNMARYGMTPTGDATTALNSSLELSQAAAEVDGKNNVRLALADRNRAIAAGGLPKAVSGGA